MNSSDNDGDEVLRCPYNKYHFASRSRFQRHLVKCEKNYPPDYKVICPYNATHRFSKSEIEEHINTCPARSTVEASYIQLSTDNVTKLSERYKSTSEIDNDVSWKSQEEARLKVPLNSKLTGQINGSIKGNMESFGGIMNIGQNSLTRHNEYFSDESIGQDRMFSNADY
ncbi:uncharacterized protein [Anoplolepis gracilipes]|uniref:uncharacterized protein isoform X2 n=1 Tax=Anoplolepis gracilipes TaxID=354296 RepID=UPI003B9EBE4B